MIEVPEERGVAAVQRILTVKPTDDAGARTADLFDWQAAMAAADGLALYMAAIDDQGRLADVRDCRVLCEYHEDWAALLSEDAELVSAKHKEKSFGAYTTINQLLDDGGLAHLFIRWFMLDKAPTCRLATSAGLSPGPAQDLEKATTFLRDQRLAGTPLSINGDPEEAITAFARALWPYTKDLSSPWANGSGRRPAEPTLEQRKQAARFLSVLTLDHDRPYRAILPYAAPGMYVKPVLERLGSPTTLAEAVWEAVLGLFRTRMRAAGPRPEGGLPVVMRYPVGASAPGVVELERELTSRIVTLTDIDVAVRLAMTHPAGYRRLPLVLRSSRLAIKMQSGDCTDNSIERAEHLKLDYQRHWSRRFSGDPTASFDKERLVRSLLRIADRATGLVAISESTWGQRFWDELQRLIDDIPEADRQPGMDADLLLGGICDLANQCKVWFGASFDVDAAIAAARARHVPQSTQLGAAS